MMPVSAGPPARRSSPAYCDVRPHSDATFTISVNTVGRQLGRRALQGAEFGFVDAHTAVPGHGAPRLPLPDVPLAERRPVPSGHPGVGRRASGSEPDVGVSAAGRPF
ncbi:hypothetical protein GCM10022205_11810 [Spinactinospora alkalitolerans]